MLPKLRYYLTNWVDGMKIHRQHFIDSENALLDAVRDAQATSLQVFNYGLLPPLAGEKSSIDINTSAAGSGKFKVVVTHCRAITAGGCRIEILPGIHPELTSDEGEETTGKSGAFYAIISVDPYNREPYGPAAAEEYPPRNASSITAYRLSLAPGEEINAGSLGANHMPVARFMLRGGELVRDNEYIPPCAVVSAHPGTKSLYNEIAGRLNQIQEFGTEIVRKAAEAGSTSNTAIVSNTTKICRDCIAHISGNFFSFRTLARNQSPVHMANTVVQLAAIINSGVSLMPVKDKEEMLQYFAYWNELSPGKFEELTGRVLNSDYNHDDVFEFFQPLLQFLRVWAELLEKLKDLRLVGQRKEGFDFGGRTMETPKEQKRGKFNIFD